MINVAGGFEPPLFIEHDGVKERAVLRFVCQRNGSSQKLIPLFLLQNGTVLMDGQFMQLSEFAIRFRNGEFTIELGDEQCLDIWHFGWIDYERIVNDASDAGFLLELEDAVRQLNGQLGFVEECRAAFAVYKSAPSLDNLELLGRTYNAVPDYLRCWLGTLDAKDSEIRTALQQLTGQPPAE